MTRYRKKPVEVEAWQVGSDEPMPEWVQRACFLNHPEEGIWFVREEEGCSVFVSRLSPSKFEQTYEVVE